MIHTMKALRNTSWVQPTVIALLSLAASGVCHAGPVEPSNDVKKIRDRADSAADAGNLTGAISAWRKGTRTAFTTNSTVAGKEYQVALVLPPSLPLAEPYPFKPFVPPWERPQPETFRWWPVAVGGALIGTGIVLGSLFGIGSDLSSARAADTLATIQSEGKSCTASPIDPRCATYERSEARSAMYSTGAIVSFVAAGAITAGVIGYAIYENHRVSVAASPTAVSMRYKW